MKYVVDKKNLAKELNISISGVNLFIKEGLPILKPTHEVTYIDLREAFVWFRDHPSPNRRDYRHFVQGFIEKIDRRNK